MDQALTSVGGAGASLERAAERAVERAVERGAEQGTENKDELRLLADQLQGVFIQQLFKAMRDTVPENGSVFGRSGSEMFSGIMDEHLADAAAVQLKRGLGQALYRQLAAQPSEGHSVGQQGSESVGSAGEEAS